jgi:hypothetical protein
VAIGENKKKAGVVQERAKIDVTRSTIGDGGDTLK